MKLPLASSSLQSELDFILNFFKINYPYVRLYLVGGAVRDMVMEREIYDLDIECFNIDPNEFDKAMKKLGAKGVGKSFFVYKYNKVDLALPRIERKVGIGHRAFEVELALDSKEASRRRDFTMNALMLDLSNGEIIDHWGGLNDIKNRVIRVVDPKKFQEDSLRVLRAMQFAARLKFRIDPNSREIMRKISLDDLTGERVFWEFEKMFNAEWLYYGLFYMNDLLIGKKILGIELNIRELIKISRHMRKARTVEDSSMRPYYFLYIISTDLHKNAESLCKAIQTPNIYIKTLRTQTKVPYRITDRFLGAVSLRMPLRKWLGVYANNTVERAKKLDIYDKIFDPGVKPADLIKEGYSGKELGIELRRRILEAIRENFGVKS
ncbi:CCA tRNA nucleotidyltransferase [Hydrogenimonas thermophila]|uniref:CCA tRNA nucleotidyltransferase n=1 Tax=Hydrogenimonas thermophila TaxID=223786 RepID=UPI00293704D3|nr:CCA tRNA nucleotidyltransferase [Hydrogenimonas thermophila]WOE69226.1 CCA tRNA nucleotidyltransferase [Hydrogenimonas thermophila]WOE71736.1 CCA tRNA nucleotidyltransferase [Hydrogenimonas thermophila]